jgi:hemerythrin-like domain-containing protein
MTAVIPVPGGGADDARMSSGAGAFVHSDPFARFRTDHANVLAGLAELERRTLVGPAPPDEASLRAALALLADQFDTHMTAEDRVLYPALLGAFPAGRPTLEALHADHAELRLMLATLGTWLGTAASAARDEQLQVVLRDFIDLLRLHIHREESAVFDVASRVLSIPEADALARRIAPLVEGHPAGGSVPGPSKGTES